MAQELTDDREEAANNLFVVGKEQEIKKCGSSSGRPDVNRNEIRKDLDDLKTNDRWKGCG